MTTLAQTQTQSAISTHEQQRQHSDGRQKSTQVSSSLSYSIHTLVTALVAGLSPFTVSRGPRERELLANSKSSAQPINPTVMLLKFHRCLLKILNPTAMTRARQTASASKQDIKWRVLLPTGRFRPTVSV